MPLTDRLASIFEEVFGFEPDRFSRETAPEDVPNWDSIGHMDLVTRLEKEFGQQFEVDEIMEMSSPAKIIAVLESKGVQG